MNFLTPEDRRRIGGKIGVTSTRPENDYPAFLQMPDGPAQNVWFSQLMHGYRSLHPSLNALPLKGILQSQTVDYRRQHPHMVCRSPIHTERAGSDSAEDVSPADDNGRLNPMLHKRSDFFSHEGDHFGADPESLITHQCFPA
jgi:hypothetical protein